MLAVLLTPAIIIRHPINLFFFCNYSEVLPRQQQWGIVCSMPRSKQQVHPAPEYSHTMTFRKEGCELR